MDFPSGAEMSLLSWAIGMCDVARKAVVPFDIMPVAKAKATSNFENRVQSSSASTARTAPLSTRCIRSWLEMEKEWTTRQSILKHYYDALKTGGRSVINGPALEQFHFSVPSDFGVWI